MKDDKIEQFFVEYFVNEIGIPRTFPEKYPSKTFWLDKKGIFLCCYDDLSKEMWFRFDFWVRFYDFDLNYKQTREFLKNKIDPFRLFGVIPCIDRGIDKKSVNDKKRS